MTPPFPQMSLESFFFSKKLQFRAKLSVFINIESYFGRNETKDLQEIFSRPPETPSRLPEGLGVGRGGERASLVEEHCSAVIFLLPKLPMQIETDLYDANR